MLFLGKPYLHSSLFPSESDRKPSSKSLLKFAEELGANLIATVAFNGPQHALATIVLQQRFARLVKFPQPRPPSLLVVVIPLRQRFARDIVPADNPRFIKASVVDPATGRMHPTRCNASQNDVHGRYERDDQVDGHERVQSGGLQCRPREAI